MYRPTVTALILVFAAIANSWLFITRVLPTLASDTPPGYQSIYASTKNTSTIAWMISLNDNPVGSALSIVEPSPSGTATIWSNLQLVDLPINDLLPPWANTLLGAHGGTLHTSIKLEAFGRMTINSRGELRDFQSIVKVPGSQQTVRLRGRITPGNKVTVSLHSGNLQYETTRHLPDNLSIRDELSPQATMPGISQGQHWTVPIYSPLRPSHKPIEILYASVAGHEALHFDDQLVNADIVNYRSTPNDHQPPRSRIWVAPHGKVLQHESTILGAKLLFMRRTDTVTLSLASRLDHVKSLFKEPEAAGVNSSQTN
tara:strand:+ start:230 stop:1171 length:942 start_codon:yes stop_codon:yes gene_type:complete